MPVFDYYRGWRRAVENPGTWEPDQQQLGTWFQISHGYVALFTNGVHYTTYM